MNLEQDRRLIAGSTIAAGFTAVTLGIGTIGGDTSPASGVSIAPPTSGLTQTVRRIGVMAILANPVPLAAPGRGQHSSWPLEEAARTPEAVRPAGIRAS